MYLSIAVDKLNTMSWIYRRRAEPTLDQSHLVSSSLKVPYKNRTQRNHNKEELQSDIKVKLNTRKTEKSFNFNLIIGFAISMHSSRDGNKPASNLLGFRSETTMMQKRLRRLSLGFTLKLKSLKRCCLVFGP